MGFSRSPVFFYVTGLFVLLVGLGSAAVSDKLDEPRFQVLVYSHTNGFRHSSIEVGIKAIKRLAEEHDFVVEATEDSTVFTEENLAKYDGVVFLNTNGDVLGEAEQAAFEAYIQHGGGFVGVHSAAATEYEWAWYEGLIGAYFKDHPEPQTGRVHVLDRVHPSTQHLPLEWERFDEWYNYRANPRGKVHVLAVLDERSYEGGTMGHDHPIAWAHEYGGGRAWYTGLGHTEESYSDPSFLQHLLGGIEWAAGAVPGDAGATMASSFDKVVLMDSVTDPMELAVASDGRVFVVERAGAIKMWSPETESMKVVGYLPVYMVIEDGLLGIALDPDFENNNWLYVFYAPPDGSDSRLSRFTLVDDWVDQATEKVLLTVHVQREFCCHAGGSLAFDPQGNLYLSTGDNSDPIDRGGSPMNELPGLAYADAQGTSGNTNDLRGKILRIRPLADGSYEIPEGNLFPGDSLHRPEIYTMGHRNPFRISIDPETGWLYWGDVGNGDPPNERGGWGWDEFNQARQAGNFGWPYFSGPNDAYRDYDYETGVIGDYFDAEAPINDSPNNTGARELPPAQPAWMWYTYGVSEIYPELGAGGINPMAGPTYRYQPDAFGETALPPYYHGKHIIYEWMRNWVQVVTMDEVGDVLDISPFLPGMDFIRPMDMEIGPEGAMYIIEWGDEFWGSNENAQVVRLDYYGHAERYPKLEHATMDEKPSNVSIDWPVQGGFFDFGEPIEYQVTLSEGETSDLSVKAFTGFDTHALTLSTHRGTSGSFQITREYTHVPDLHFVDRFAELEACIDGEDLSSECKKVKLHPKRKEAEHTASKKDARRVTHGLHPASKQYEASALTVMQVENGSGLVYAPVNLAQIESITLRLKQKKTGSIDVRLDGSDGPLLANIVLDSTTVANVSLNDQGKAIEAALQHDEALSVQGLDRSVYEGWTEVTVPITDPGGTHELHLLFHSDERGQLLELDWLHFNGKGVNK